MYVFCVSLCFLENRNERLLCVWRGLESSVESLAGLHVCTWDVMADTQVEQLALETVEVPSSAEGEGTAGTHVSLLGNCTESSKPEGGAAESGAPAGVSTESKAPEGVAKDTKDLSSVAEALPDTVTCRRCSQQVAVAEALCTPKFRPALRYTCRNCHAVCSQLQRRGIDIKDVLSEQAAVTFFQDAKAERCNGMEGRLCYGQCRALLKQKMVETTSFLEKSGAEGAFQPLSHWMLQGYDCDRIAALAECREHPILGATYRVDIDKMSQEQIRSITEERLLHIESQARERQELRSKAPQGAAPQPDLGIEVEAVTVGDGKKRKSSEEKQAAAEAAKVQKKEDKKREKQERCAASAAAKVLPQMKKCVEKLDAALEKVVREGAGLPEASAEHIAETKKKLEEACKNATQLLTAASKGQNPNLASEVLQSEKDLNGIVKDGNAAIRTLHYYVREKKDAAKAMKQQQVSCATKAKGKK